MYLFLFDDYALFCRFIKAMQDSTQYKVYYYSLVRKELTKETTVISKASHTFLFFNIFYCSIRHVILPQQI